MTEQVIISGFGGQGVMSLGQILAYGGMIENKEVSWLPSYGPEMRGGSANCQVIVSDESIGMPLVPVASAVLAMNLPSLLKFEGIVEAGGKILINSSLIEQKAVRSDISAYYIPCNEIAAELGNARVAGMVMLGAFLKLSGILSIDAVVEALKKVFGAKKADLIPLNKAALERGAALV